jgi:hypothetical protein
MNRIESHCHLDNLPLIDTFFVNEAHNAVYSWPDPDYTESPCPGIELVPTPATSHLGVDYLTGSRHGTKSRTIFYPSTFSTTIFGQELIKNLGQINSRYLYNSPWSLYDWHQDLARHNSAINFVLSDNPGARTIHRFPTDCRLHYRVELTEYELYKPVLFNAKIDHAVINLSDKPRYILSVIILDSDYDTAKEYLKNYKSNKSGYL